jgi:predicted secreted protein
VKKPDGEFTKADSPGKVNGKAILRLWKLIPDVAAAVALAGRVFGLLVKESKTPKGSRDPWGKHPRGYTWFEGDDLGIIAHLEPSWASAYKSATGQAVPDKLPYWYRERQMLRGDTPMENHYDVATWLRANRWKERSDIWWKKVGPSNVGLQIREYSGEVWTFLYWPKGMAMEDKEAFREATTVKVSIRGSFGKDLEDAAIEAAQGAKKFRTRTKKVRTEDEAAMIKEFLERVEKNVLEMDRHLAGGKTTRWIADFLFGNGGPELLELLPYNVNRREAGKMVRRVLEKMAKAGKIEKDTGGGQPEWFKASSLRVADRKLAMMSHAASIALMKWLSVEAKKLGVAKHVYVVGGAVRNFVIDKPIKDIDMVVDSLALRGDKDAAWVAEGIARRIPAPTKVWTDNLMVSHINIEGPWDLDGHEMQGNDIEIVNARDETYEQDEAGDYVGHKPTRVDPTTLEIDVTRREFTFNTLMWRLLDLAGGPEKAEIIDLTGCGLRDLENREMRCPQDPDLTFKQDPTRIIRTIKFAFKYGMKLPPDVKAAAKRQAKGLKRIPAKAWTVLREIVLESSDYKKALVVMDDLGVIDVIKEMVQENDQFATTLGNYSQKRGVAFMFDLMDLGVPVGSAIAFLDGGQKRQFRQITAPMDRDEALNFLDVLKQPGIAYGDKRFIPELAEAHGYAGKGMREFMPFVDDTARTLLLDDPSLAGAPGRLKRLVEQGVASSGRVAAKYKDKKKIKTEDGEETTVYEYSEGQVDHRHREKAKKLEGLRQSIDELRKKVKKDLGSDDPDVRLTALAVAVIDETCERPGNDESAEERGHFGVTTLQKRHVSFSGGKAVLKYTGKSGVDHEKTVEDSKAVAELKKALKGKKGDDLVFCDGDDCTIRAKDVNAYLEPFDVTAKDIRGMRANEEMKTRLKKLRADGPELPKDRKEKDEILKKEFDQALKETAEVVGHEEATLKGEYLVPKLESSYMHDGTVIDKLHGKSAASLPLQAFIVGIGGRDKLFDEAKLPRGKLRISEGGGPDKPVGAFWTSSVEGSSTAWIDWCRYEMPGWIGDQAALFKVKSSAKILWITDYEKVWEKYGLKTGGSGRFGKALDWNAVAKDYDGATCPGYGCIYAWDAESTAWFNMNALEFLRVVDIDKKCAIPDPELDDWEQEKDEYSLRLAAGMEPAESAAISLLQDAPDESLEDLIEMVRDARSLFDPVSRSVVDNAEVIQALRRLAPKPYQVSGGIKVYHATDSSTAKMLAKRGFIPQTKPRSRVDTYAPGRGVDRGLYVGATPRSVEGYGRVILEVTVPRKAIEVPTELAQLGETSPMAALKSHDGAVVNDPIPGEAFKVVKGKRASAERVAFRHLSAAAGPSFRRVARIHLAAELAQLGRELTEAWGRIEKVVDEARGLGISRGDARLVRNRANSPWVDAMTAGRQLAKLVLTEKSIPKGLHKKVEMAARFFMSARRMPKDMYKWIAKNGRHYVLIMQAMGWPEKQAGGQEMFDAGPFTVHNTLGLEDDALRVIKTAIERAAKLIKTTGAPGISSVLYGDVHVVGRLQGGTTLAWYNPGDDKVYVRALDSAGHDSVHSLVHELGHRYWKKNASKDAQREWVRHHRSVSSGETANFDDVDAAMPKVGDPLPFKVRGVRGGPPIVTDIKSGQHWFKGKIKGVERELSFPSHEVRMSLYKQMAQKATWPTPYSKKNYEEHFCEALALKALKGLKEPHLEAFQRIWG